MRISLFHTVTALVLFLSMSGTSFAAGELTVADVQAVTKLAAVREIAKGSIPGAGGTINFVRSDGKLLVLINIGKASDYTEAAKAFPQRTAVRDLGDEAFMPNAAPWALYVRKGSKLVGVGSGLDPATGEQILTGGQIQELAKRVPSRL